MPDWYPDWSGETCVIVAGGPSAKGVQLEQARGRAKVVVINTSYRLAPWADVLYACDLAWWAKHQGVPDFPGLKVSQDTRAVSGKNWGVRLVRTDRSSEGMVRKPLGRLGWGGNSGFHCLNMVVQFGASRIALVGYDMRVDLGVHWHGSHPHGLNNPSARAVDVWRKALDGVAPQLQSLGVTVVNCSPVSTLSAYPKMALEEALA